MYFNYGEKETEYLRSKDKKLAEVIDRIGHIYRPVDINLFASIAHHIIGQKISTKAQATIWQCMIDTFGIPCHRVIGSNGNLTGYAGGLEKKRRLLAIESIATRKYIG